MAREIHGSRGNSEERPGVTHLNSGYKYNNMVDFPSNFLDLNSIYGFASSQSYTYWIGLGINLILSTIVGGIVLMVVLEIFSKKFKEPIKPVNAFLVVLIVNIINMFGILGLLLPYMAAIPYVGLILPIIIWIIFVKAFFGELSFLHAIAIGVVFYIITIFALPYLTGIVAGFIPGF
jgi:hypothetical protein